MKEFSIEAFKNGVQVVTRDGRNVRILCTDSKYIGYPILGLIDNGGNTQFAQWTINGEYYLGESGPSDLVLKTEKYTGWVNIYKSRALNRICVSGVFSTWEEAKKKSRPYVVDIIKIEWEGGEYEEG